MGRVTMKQDPAPSTSWLGTLSVVVFVLASVLVSSFGETAANWDGESSQDSPTAVRPTLESPLEVPATLPVARAEV
jgi:hypothetical protein